MAGTVFNTPEFVLSFPNLFRPKARKLKSGAMGEPKYGVTAVFPKASTQDHYFTGGVAPDTSPLVAAMLAAAEEAFGRDRSKWGRMNKTLKTVGGSHDMEISVTKWFGEDFPGALVVDFTSKQPVGVVDHNVQRILDENAVYAGCICIAQVNVFTYDNDSRGVGFGLRNIQKVRDGKRLGGGMPAEQAFKPATGGPAPGSAAEDSDIPF